MFKKKIVSCLFLITISILIFTSVQVGVKGQSDCTVIVDSSGGGDYLSIQEGLDMSAPGDTICVRGSTDAGNPRVYNGYLRLNQSHSGTVGNIKTLKADGSVSIQKGASDSRCHAFVINTSISYFTIDGFEITNFDCFAFQFDNDEQSIDNPSQYITLRNLKIHDLGANEPEGSFTGTLLNCQHVLIENVELYRNASGINIGGNSFDVVIRNSSSHDMRHQLDGDGFNASNWGEDEVGTDYHPHNITIEDTNVYNNGEDGFDFKADDVTYRRCRSYNNRARGIAVKGLRQKIVNSLIYGNEKSVSISGWRDSSAAIINSTLISDYATLSYSAYPFVMEAVVINSIFVSPDRTVQILEGHKLFGNNNIYYNSSNDGTVVAYYRELDNGGIGDVIETFYMNDINSGHWSSQLDYYDVGDETDSSSQGINPAFVDLEGYNLQLRSDSTAIDAGIPDYNFTGTNYLPASIIEIPTTDIDGNLRDSNPDIGAYEYGGSPEPTIIPTPTLAPSLNGDLNNDGTVNIFDLVIVGSCFGQDAVGDCARADANGNGVVDIFDLVLVGGNFGEGG
ncbi:hypothetical protein KKB83_05665 [Patescibacteria group bacterium]|nr:hypothetical protein [Patescibacteria group bacterium]